jgi:hypothetical protein
MYEVLDYVPNHDDIKAFLRRLKSALTARELDLKGMTTDGSVLYPDPICEVFWGGSPSDLYVPCHRRSPRVPLSPHLTPSCGVCPGCVLQRNAVLGAATEGLPLGAGMPQRRFQRLRSGRVSAKMSFCFTHLWSEKTFTQETKLLPNVDYVLEWKSGDPLVAAQAKITSFLAQHTPCYI